MASKEEENNKEFADGYGSGRSGDFVRDTVVQFNEDPDSQWKKGYDDGVVDRNNHGYKSADDCGDGSTSSDSSSGCFLTTACTLARGLPDDCLELTTLRGFRDKFLLPHKKSDVREYYDVAPDIVSAVNEKEDAYGIWNSVYTDIKHAVSLVMQGKNNEAYEHYKDMTLKLKQEYL